MSKSYLLVYTNDHQEEIMNNDPFMKRYIEMGNDLHKLYPGNKYYYYYVDDVVVAQAYVQPPKLDKHPMLRSGMNGMYYIWAVETHPEFRGKGYATKLLKKIIKGDRKYFLAVLRENKIARSLYTKLGFKKDHYYNKHIIIMKLNFD